MNALLIGIVLLLFVTLFIIRFVKKTLGDERESKPNRIGDGLRKLNADMQKYTIMTEALLVETEDESLLAAVLANLWAKMRPDLSDANAVMAGLSRERQMVYALYAVTGGVMQESLASVIRGKDGSLVPACADALTAIGAVKSADILLACYTAENPDLYTDAYLDAFDAENGKMKMVHFIRENSAAFCDERVA